MSKQIIRVSPLQAAKVSAALYFIIGAIFAIPMGLITMLLPASEGAEQATMGLGFFIAMPFLYAIMAFIFTPIFCWIYNIVAGLIGGFEITLNDSDDV